jgi:hypothetical protein
VLAGTPSEQHPHERGKAPLLAQEVPGMPPLMGVIELSTALRGLLLAYT